MEPPIIIKKEPGQPPLVQEQEISLKWLNTKNCCFLCLKNASKEIKVVQLRSLLQHLKIIILSQNLNVSPEVEKIDEIEVDLCKSCGELKGRLGLLFKELEKVQLEINYFLGEAHKRIDEAEEDSERMEGFARKMGNGAQLEFVEGLRTELSRKCKIMQQGRQPRITLTREPTRRPEVIPEEDNQNIDEEFIFIDELEDLNGSNDLISNTDDATSVPECTSAASQDVSKVLTPSASSSQTEEASNPQDAPEASENRFIEDLTTGLFSCSLCDKTFKRKYCVTSHLQSVHLQKKFKCRICNMAEFSSKNNLTAHKRTCREMMNQRLERKRTRDKFKLCCETCQKKFKDRDRLNRHLNLVHLKLRIYSCDVCNQKFQLSSDLIAHKLEVHQESKSFSCQFCSKEYAYKNDCLRHEKTCNKRK